MTISEMYENKTGKNYIYNICPFSNISSVLEQGILSYHNASKIVHTSIAIPEIQGRRDVTKVPNGLSLHHYANCFFNPRNSMLYSKQNEFDKIAILCISNEVLNLPDVVISDKNASAKLVAFYSAEIGINILNFDEIFMRSWDSSDPFEKERLKAVLHAEVLVPDKIDAKYIKEIKVASEKIKNNLARMIENSDIIVSVDSDLFFNKGGCL